MSYEKNIEIYKMKKDVITPLASNPKIQASCTEGDFIIIIDNEVYVRDYVEGRSAQFAKADYSPDFVRMNKFLFEIQL